VSSTAKIFIYEDLAQQNEDLIMDHQKLTVCIMDLISYIKDGTQLPLEQFKITEKHKEYYAKFDFCGGTEKPSEMDLISFSVLAMTGYKLSLVPGDNDSFDTKDGFYSNVIYDAGAVILSEPNITRDELPN
jgi:hypothetical protein